MSTPIETLTIEDLTADGITHAFFTRKGGVSEGIYEGLQCGRGASNDSRDNVAKNRAYAARTMGVPRESLISVHQHHSNDVQVVTAPWRPGKAPKADAMVTENPGIALGILTADCAPVLFMDPKAKIIGAAHAGWKGALGGVLEATVEAMIALGAERQRIRAGIGPCITQVNYQVDEAFRDRFVTDESGNARHFGPDPEDGKHRFDLPGYCQAVLKAYGVRQSAFCGACTYADEERFYSNRRALHRGEDDYGRGLSAITLV